MLPIYGQIGRMRISRQLRCCQDVNRGLQMYGMWNLQSLWVKGVNAAVSATAFLFQAYRRLSMRSAICLEQLNVADRPTDQEGLGGKRTYSHRCRTRWRR